MTQFNSSNMPAFDVVDGAAQASMGKKGLLFFALAGLTTAARGFGRRG